MEIHTRLKFRHFFKLYSRGKWRKKKQGSAHLPWSGDEERVRLGGYRQGEIHPHFSTCWHWNGCGCHKNLKKNQLWTMWVIFCILILRHFAAQDQSFDPTKAIARQPQPV
jgi:hypothetical protein